MRAIRYGLMVAATVGSLLAADQTLLNLAPADTKMVAGIYVDRTRNTPFGQFVLTQMKADDANFRTFVASTGFDPRRDLNEVLMVSSTVQGRKSHNGLILAKGIFNGPQILAAAKAKGGVSSLYQGVELVTKSKTDSGVLAVLDGSLALAGDPISVKAAIDRRQSSSALDPQLAAKITQLSGQFDAWFVASGFAAPVSGAVTGGALPGNLPVTALQAIEQTSGGIKFGSVVQVSGEAVARSEKDAQALVDVTKFLTGMLALNSDKSPQATKLAGLIQGLNVKAQGNTVQMMLSVPETDLEDFLQSGKNLKRASIR